MWNTIIIYNYYNNNISPSHTTTYHFQSHSLRSCAASPRGGDWTCRPCHREQWCARHYCLRCIDTQGPHSPPECPPVSPCPRHPIGLWVNIRGRISISNNIHVDVCVAEVHSPPMTMLARFVCIMLYHCYYNCYFAVEGVVRNRRCVRSCGWGKVQPLQTDFSCIHKQFSLSTQLFKIKDSKSSPYTLFEYRTTF